MKKRVSTKHNLLYEQLEHEVAKRNSLQELCFEKPDPLWIATLYKDEFIALICALFAYGNAMSIVKFLQTLDFSLLDQDESAIRVSLDTHYYRFQTSHDTQEFFLTLCQAKQQGSLEALFLEGYIRNKSVMDGLKTLISYLYDINPYRSRGYEFLLGKVPQNRITSPYKRWHMFLRWMVRHDNLDLGLWHGVERKDLLMPLDIHTFSVGKKLGLITHARYDFKAVLELTQKLKEFDINDPVKYDFALYRIGQEKIVI